MTKKEYRQYLEAETYLLLSFDETIRLYEEYNMFDEDRDNPVLQHDGQYYVFETETRCWGPFFNYMDAIDFYNDYLLY